ncbi:hypothetical protein IM538_17140 [Cytobacillus suaedae]|nr:hypothetical protein IM538_17140 [Cytobacillus suaedae]
MRVLLGLMFTVIFITGCQSSHQLYEVSDMPHKEEKDVLKGQVPAPFFSTSQQIFSLDMNGEAFNTVGEWFDDESVLYIVDKDGGSDIYYYHLFTGEKKLFYHTDAPIVTMKANEDHSLFLIHASSERNAAELFVVNKEGEKVYDWKINSFDLQFVWNPNVLDEIFVTAFLEDWSFSTFVLEIGEETMTPYTVNEPFVQWFDKQSISYMRWNQEEPVFSAPLYTFNFETNEESLLLEDVISFTTFKDVLFTVSNDKVQTTKGIYSLYDIGTMDKKKEIMVPLLTTYSRWYVPYHDYVTNQKKFYSFLPGESASYDTYTGKFELIAFSLEADESETILSSIDSLPINFSPNGYYCLYGYQYEKVIDVKAKEVKELIQL